VIASAVSKRFWAMWESDVQRDSQHSRASIQANALKVLVACLFASASEKILLWGKLGFANIACAEDLRALRYLTLQY
jgi:hypothetical protein